MKYSVFVDGSAGTTGLKINERLALHPYVELIKIAEEKRKDEQERRKAINSADIVFLCLPDDAAREAVSFLDNSKNNTTIVIDPSTAHRTNLSWAYGLPELSLKHREAIATSNRITNPGCHATAFALAIYPLIKTGILSADYPVSCHTVTGYSGGGRQLIEKYNSSERHKQDELISARHYALSLYHKHLPEMKIRTELLFDPIFTPILGDFAQGLAAAIPIHNRIAGGKAQAARVHEVLSDYYRNERFVKVMPLEGSTCLGDPYFNPMALNGTNMAEIFVYGDDEKLLLISRIDNLGKGASGAAVQNMNIVLGIDEGTGL